MFLDYLRSNRVDGIIGIEYILDETGEFTGICKLLFETSAQAEQSILKIDKTNFVGQLLKAIVESKAPRAELNSKIRVTNIDY